MFGCTGLKREYPERNYFTLQVVNTIKSSQAQGRHYLKVQRVDLNPLYFAKEFNYKTGPDEFKSDFYNQFYKSIDDIITGQIYSWLSNSGLFKDVLPFNSIINAEYILDSNIIDIYADFTDPSNPRSILNIQFFLVDDTKDTATLKYTRVINQEVSISGMTPEAAVDGWNKALKNILTELQSDLASIPNL